MKEFLKKMVPVTGSDHFPFRCQMCGACCRHVKESVPIDSLDAFRLARFLRNKDKRIRSMDDVLELYAEPVLLHESGYMAFMLKTVGDEDACIFLKVNRCTIHKEEPKACRTYPISVGPDGYGGQEQYLSMEQTHHYVGPLMSVKKWIRRRCNQEDYDFWELDVGLAREMALLLEKVPQSRMSQALMCFLRYKYSDFDMDQPFTPQFRRNQNRLMEALRALAQEK